MLAARLLSGHVCRPRGNGKHPSTCAVRKPEARQTQPNVCLDSTLLVCCTDVAKLHCSELNHIHRETRHHLSPCTRHRCNMLKNKNVKEIQKQQTCQYGQTVNQRESTKVLLLGASSYFKFSAFSRHSTPRVGFRVRVWRRGGRHARATTAGDMRWSRLWLEAASVVPALHHSANGTPRVADESGKLKLIFHETLSLKACQEAIQYFVRESRQFHANFWQIRHCTRLPENL